MNLSDRTRERSFTTSLVNLLVNLPYVPTHQQVEETAEQLAKLANYTGDLKAVVIEAMASVNTTMGLGVSLVDVEAQHDDGWVLKRKQLQRVYADAYVTYLLDTGWSPRVVQAMDVSTTRILGHLQDPESEGSTWNRRGLVIGHVQSGKTSNYIGLIAKAADAGYKFIIVIAGIHNNLRRQTQQRIDEAFIGRSSDPNNRRTVGVGTRGSYPYPATLTNIYEDFNKNTAAKSGWRINDFSKPIILVIKKNVATLTALHKWLRDLNAGGEGRISDVPMLLIDDEADNASVNTNKEDLDPTRTNAMIRKILSLFSKSCYVGYTATPFANIFISPEAYDEEVREELFPRDFIYCLDAPSNYFGPQRVFLDDASSDAIVRTIDDAEELIPHNHKRDTDLSDLPPSLYRAIDEFIVARAIRNLRGQESKHCSMMINVSRFVSKQKYVRDLVRMRVRRIQAAVTANYMMPESHSSANVDMQRLKSAFDKEYATLGFSWQAVKVALHGVFSNFHTYVINSKSDEVLDFTRYDREGIGLTCIAVGGLSLSRGLTIEGLTMSYMYRNTKMYDTLMQMGRWFGYRHGYEDLCRVYLSRDSINWYSHIALAADELINQIHRMRQDGLSPRQFGLYVKAHPDSLLITAANKMRTGERVTVKQNYSSRLMESYIVSIDPEVNRKNFALIEQEWRRGFGGHVAEETRKGIIFRDVKSENVAEFLLAFQTHDQFSDRKHALIDYLYTISHSYPTSDVILISPQGNGSRPFCLNGQVRTVSAVSGTAWRLNKDRVSSRGDEGLGLSQAQVDEAHTSAAAEEMPVEPSDRHYREVRNKPLLMIHSLEPDGNPTVKGPIAAFGVSFPPGDYVTEVSVVANRIWLERMQGVLDDPDEEEDYDG